jgi:hypothetical protein
MSGGNSADGLQLVAQAGYRRNRVPVADLTCGGKPASPRQVPCSSCLSWVLRLLITDCQVTRLSSSSGARLRLYYAPETGETGRVDRQEG